MSSALRYNLRQRASGPRPGARSGLAPPPGTLLNSSARGADTSPLSDDSDSSMSVRSDARVRPGVLYSQVGRTPAGAYRGSLSDQEAHPRASGTHPVPRRGQEARPRTESSQPGAASDNTSMSSSNKENKIPSPTLPEGSENAPSAEAGSMEASGGGQWTEVRRKRRARSLEGATQRDLPPHK